MKVVVATVGSLGDLLPFMMVAESLRLRRHEVIFATNQGYETFIRLSGFGFTPIWDDRHLQKDLDQTILSDPEEAWTIIERDLFKAASGPAYDAIKQVAQTGKNTILAPWSLTGATRAHQELGIPLCRAYLSPHAITLAAKRETAPATRELAFFPDWFGARRSGWPQKLSFCGFPFYSDAVLPPFPPPLEAFLAHGDPPVVFTPGSFRRNPGAFFRQSREACTALGLRAVFLSPNGMEALQDLPPTMIHFPYVPLQRLLPRAAALVHHGGIGTCAQAMRAAVPQFMTPLFFDQFDNARIVEQLEVGRSLAARDYAGPQAANILGQMLQSQAMKANCARIAANLGGGNAAAAVRDAIEALA
jgi:UDP:flavonoid glycosyltransferase YjiC (YdhE family)